MLKNYLAGIDREQTERAYEIFQKNYSPEKIEIIKKLKEEEYQDGFLRDIFADVLGYTLKPEEGFNLVREFKNQSDAGKADGAILKKDKAIAVIELKSAKTKDLKMITEQAFSYKNKQPGCKYVITSNFQKLHFYIDYANEYEEFDLFRLDREDFERMFLILCKDSILHDRPEKLKKESVNHEEKVSKQLYADYSVFRKKLFENLVRNNPEIDKLTLFSKSQTLIDRFLFILFAEDKGLLPPNSINRIIERFHTLKREDAYKPLYEIYKQYFGYMNTGRPGKRAIDDIPAYNGGLFYPDELLYDLKIDDDILIEDLRKLSAYDFDTEVDVNILGHIFEHSLSETEETTARIKGIDLDKSKSRRKKDGIFYTPQYITQYIVDNTIGRLCEEKRSELDIAEIEVDESCYTKKGNLSKKGKVLYQKVEDYKKWLLSLKILDPACGSGAFLNQALSFLIREHNFIIEIQTDLKKGQVSMFNVEKAVLENNLYGVDINAESVEITKLSLWLRTAHRERKLSNLNSNIRCGNSLIDDPEIAG
ncbi:MAG: DNA methyltransferase, partial [Desulfococcaceae bacterium]|nr:DNA methyltransferase [Desulfococcaceae bacterium]